MGKVTVIILHPPPEGDGPLTSLLHEARLKLAEHHVALFRDAGAGRVLIEEGPRTLPFGARLDELAASVRGGLVLLGAGAVPLLRPADARRLVDTARARGRVAMTNNRYSSDVIAVADAGLLRGLGDGTGRQRTAAPARRARRQRRGAARPRTPGPRPGLAARPRPARAGARHAPSAPRSRGRREPGRAAAGRAPCRRRRPRGGAARLRSSVVTQPGLAGTPDSLSDPLPVRGARPADGTCRPTSGPRDPRPAPRRPRAGSAGLGRRRARRRSRPGLARACSRTGSAATRAAGPPAGGSLRLGPATASRRRRSVAAGADRRARPSARDTDPAWRVTRWSGRDCAGSCPPGAYHRGHERSARHNEPGAALVRSTYRRAAVWLVGLVLVAATVAAIALGYRRPPGCPAVRAPGSGRLHRQRGWSSPAYGFVFALLVLRVGENVVGWIFGIVAVVLAISNVTWAYVTYATETVPPQSPGRRSWRSCSGSRWCPGGPPCWSSSSLSSRTGGPLAGLGLVRSSRPACYRSSARSPSSSAAGPLPACDGHQSARPSRPVRRGAGCQWPDHPRVVLVAMVDARRSGRSASATGPPDDIGRLQLKWLVYAGGVLVVCGLIFWIWAGSAYAPGSGASTAVWLVAVLAAPSSCLSLPRSPSCATTSTTSRRSSAGRSSMAA